jgi:TetR/AcrR family transcriptional regulator, transcriptional repressor for nem operon
MNKGEATRQRIVEAAAPLFNQHGFAGCSMQDVMDATGLEKGGLYRHFGSKEELAAESFRYALSQSVKTRTDDLSEINGAVAKLQHVVDRFVVTPSLIKGGCPLLNTAIDADDGNVLLRGLVQDAIQSWKSRLAAIAEEGRKKGEIRSDVDAQQVANTIVGLLEGSLMISRIEGNRDALKDAGKTLHGLIAGLAS